MKKLVAIMALGFQLVGIPLAGAYVGEVIVVDELLNEKVLYYADTATDKTKLFFQNNRLEYISEDLGRFVSDGSVSRKLKSYLEVLLRNLSGKEFRQDMKLSCEDWQFRESKILVDCKTFFGEVELLDSLVTAVISSYGELILVEFDLLVGLKMEEEVESFVKRKIRSEARGQLDSWRLSLEEGQEVTDFVYKKVLYQDLEEVEYIVSDFSDMSLDDKLNGLKKTLNGGFQVDLLVNQNLHYSAVLDRDYEVVKVLFDAVYRGEELFEGVFEKEGLNEEVIEIEVLPKEEVLEEVVDEERPEEEMEEVQESPDTEETEEIEEETEEEVVEAVEIEIEEFEEAVERVKVWQKFVSRWGGLAGFAIFSEMLGEREELDSESGAEVFENENYELVLNDFFQVFNMNESHLIDRLGFVRLRAENEKIDVNVDAEIEVVEDEGESESLELVVGDEGLEEVSKVFHYLYRFWLYFEGLEVDLVEGLKVFVNSEKIWNTQEGCGSFYDTGKVEIHYAQGGALCRYINDTESESVILHEFGHFVMTNIRQIPSTKGSESLAIQEGVADYLAASYLDDSLVGEGVFRDPRNLNNSLKLADFSSDDYRNSLIFSGALWQIRAELGQEVADSLVVKSLYAGRRTFEDFMFQLLIEDDDNFNLLDGTPNAEVILNSFYERGIGVGFDRFFEMATSIELPDEEEFSEDVLLYAITFTLAEGGVSFNDLVLNQVNEKSFSINMKADERLKMTVMGRFVNDGAGVGLYNADEDFVLPMVTSSTVDVNLNRGFGVYVDTASEVVVIDDKFDNDGVNDAALSGEFQTLATLSGATEHNQVIALKFLNKIDTTVVPGVYSGTLELRVFTEIIN